MTATATRLDLTAAHQIYSDAISPLQAQYQAEQNAGGKMRSATGSTFETIAQSIIYAIDDSIVCKHNDYIAIESTPGSGLINKVQVDLHLYKDGELMALVECKTYLDKSMLTRAVAEFGYIREEFPGVPAAIFMGQMATDIERLEWMQDRHNFETFVVNTTKQRRSDSPIFKTGDPLDEQALQSFAAWVQAVVDNF
jgi:hypothetical protein